jgi:multidrug efflux pump subunit AcrB
MNPDPMKKYKGPIAWMAQNSVAANLLMLVILIGGLMGGLRMKQEVFPEFDMDMVNVTVPYPGASPLDVEQGIVLVVEEEVRGIDGVKQVNSTSSESVGIVTIELLLDANADKSLADIKSAVDRIQSFPEEAEKPVVSLVTRKREVISLVIAGDQELTTLHQIAERARDELLAHPNITQVEIEGVPPLEISIEVSRENLEAYGMTLGEVARQVRAASLELPGGMIETKGGQLLVRVSDRRLSQTQFSQIVLRGTAQGGQVLLGDVATIRDGFEDTKQASFFNGMPAVRLTVYRIGAETPTEVATAVKDYVPTLSESLPDNIAVTTWTDSSKRLSNRMKLLMKNAAIGLVLVLVALALLLKARIAFWVAVGIPIAFMGSFIILNGTDQSINMISLFAMIIALGMVVDDAIIIAENAFSKMQDGMPRAQAAIEGTQEMVLPVTFSVLTTLAAFLPLMFVPGMMGKIFFLIPVVVVSILIFSLVEVYFILPTHLSHGKSTPPGRIAGWVEARRITVSGGLIKFVNNYYEPALRWVLDHRYLALSIAVCQLLIIVGVTVSGIWPFNFFPDIEDDEVVAIARLPYGAPIERTLEVQRLIEQAARDTIEQLGGESITTGIFTQIGEVPGSMHGGGESGSHLLAIEVGLAKPENEESGARNFAAVWKQLTPAIAGLEALTYNINIGPSAGAAVDLQISHADTNVLAKASDKIAQAMSGYPELSGIENSYATGKPQFDFHLLPAARTVGLTAQEVARQIRSSFYGAQAIREQRGRNELKIMVRLPQNQRSSEFDLEQLRIRTPHSGMIPLSYVADFDRSRAPTDIKREQGRRIINVTAKLQPGVPSPRPILESLMNDVVPDLRKEFPGLNVSLAGQQQSQKESFASLGQNFLFALFLIFALLAIPLRSYIQPFIIMSAIPFGLGAAILGHIIMGYALSVISVLGIVALAGVVINDTLVLIVTANRNRETGMTAYESIVAAGMRRFRPILLTSVTTFLGLAPMIVETSIQAKFLIPMAISLGFGILLSLPVALMIVPAVYMMVEDMLNLRKKWTGNAV